MARTLERRRTLKRKIYIDASLIKSSGCLRAVCLKSLGGYKSFGRDFKMEYGTGFHHFTETFYLTGSKEAAIIKAINYYSNPEIEIPEKDFRTPEHLLMTCNQYAEYWQEESFEIAINAEGKLVVEERFCVRILETDSAEVYLFGKLDVVGRELGQPAVMDHKVTSSYNPDTYLEGYKLSTQLMVYDYGMRRLAADNPTTFGAYADPAFIIDGIFISKSRKAIFQRSDLIKFSPFQRHWFEVMLKNLAEDLAEFSNTKDFRFFPPTGFLTGACDGKYFRPCEFSGICKEHDLEIANLKLAGDFERREYSPAIFDGEEE